MMNKFKNMKGITLIALVITIIVLLILAGVSIAMLTGQNGIITQAQKSKQVTEETSEQEKRNLSQAEANAHLEAYTYTDAEENTAKIPAGFAVSNVEGENLVSKGLVIIGSNGNEYVWIPCTDDTYKREETTWGVGNDNGIKAEKDELTLKGITPSDEEKQNGITPEVLNEIFEQVKNEINSVKNNGGYYIGRYEVGKQIDNAVIKANQEPYSGIKWSKAYEKAKGIDAGTSAASYLCSSYAWDTAIKFIQTHSTATNYGISRDNFNGNWIDKEVKDKTGKIIKESNTAEKLNTGLTTSYANIYDMGGNVAEFTTELNPNNTNSLVVRGGNYYNSFSAAGSRWAYNSNSAVENYGFRSTIFLK